MNADAKDNLPWIDETAMGSSLLSYDDDLTEFVPVVQVLLDLDEEPTSSEDAPTPEASQEGSPEVTVGDEEPSVVVSPELTVMEPRTARALEALWGQAPLLPSVLQRVGDAVAAPFGYAGAAGQRLWMTLASPAFRSDIERLTSGPKEANGSPAQGAQLGRVTRRAAALLLPTIAMTALLAIVSFPRLGGIDDAFASSTPPYELTPLVESEGAGVAAHKSTASEPLRTDWPTALRVPLTGAHDDGADRR